MENVISAEDVVNHLDHDDVIIALNSHGNTTTTSGARRKSSSGLSPNASFVGGAGGSVNIGASTRRRVPLFLVPPSSSSKSKYQHDNDDIDNHVADEMNIGNHSTSSTMTPQQKTILQSIRLKNWISQHYNAVMICCILLILICIALATIGAMHITDFVSHTTEVLNPPSDTNAYKAEQAFKVAIPSQAEVSYFNVFVTFHGRYFDEVNGPTATPTSSNSSSPKYNITLLPTLCNFLNKLEKSLSQNSKTKPHFQSMGNYCQLSKIDFLRIADHFISPDGTSVTAPIICNVTRFNSAAKTFGEGVQEIVDDISASYLTNSSTFSNPATSYNSEFNRSWTYTPSFESGDFIVGVNGLSTFLTSIAKTSKRDLIAAMEVTMPMLLVLLILRLRGSISLVLIVVAAAGGHLCSSFGAMRPVDSVMNVSSPTPLLMFCMGIGLSLMFGLLIVVEFGKRTRKYFDPLLIASHICKKEVVVIEKNQSADDDMKTRLHYIVDDDDDDDDDDDEINNEDNNSPPPASSSILEEDIEFDEAILNQDCQQVHTQYANLLKYEYQLALELFEQEKKREQATSSSSEKRRVSFAKQPPPAPTIPSLSTLEISNVDHARIDIFVDVIFSTVGAISIASFTLLCSLSAMLFFPASIIQSLGIGCVMTVVAAWIYACPFVLALLFVGFPYFVHCTYPTGVWYKFSAIMRKVGVVPLKSCCWKGKPCDCCVGCDDYALDGEDENENENDVNHEEKETIVNNASDNENHHDKVSYTKGTASDSLLLPSSHHQHHHRTLKNKHHSSPPSSPNYSDMGKETLSRELDGDNDQTHIETPIKKFFQKYGKIVTPLTLLTGFVIFYLVNASHMTLSNSYIAYLGRNSPVTKDYISFVNAYGYGMTAPYRVLFTLKPNATWKNETNNNKEETIDSIFQEPYWYGSQQVVKRILSDPILGPQVHMAGPIVIGPNLQNLTTIVDCLFHKNGCDDESIWAFIFNQVSKDHRSMYLMMTAKFDPLGEDGWSMYQRILKMVEPTTTTTNDVNNNETTETNFNGNNRVFDVYIDGSGPSAEDCVHSIYERVPILAPIAVAIAVVVVFFLFHRSFLNALRFAYSLGASLAGSIGLAVLVYQMGAIKWVDIVIFDEIGYIPWIMPIIVFAMCLGLCTAFDVIWVMIVCVPTTEGGVVFSTSTTTNNDNNNNKKTITKLQMKLMGKSVSNFHEQGSVYFLGIVVVLSLFGLALSDVPLMNVVGFSCCTSIVFAGFMIPQGITLPVFDLFSDAMKKY